jgi:putative modified peptide
MSHQDLEEEHLRQAANVRISMNLTPREVFKLMTRLATDDAFRAKVEADPYGTLAEHNIRVPSRDIPLNASLPPKEELQQVLIDIMSGHQGSVTALAFNVDPQYWFFMDFLIFLVHRAPQKLPD